MTDPFEIITDPDVIARREARAKEYGTWECGSTPISFDGARAFNEGDPVPASTVERFALDKLGSVVESGTHARKLADAEQARADAEKAAVDAAVEAANPKPSKAAKATTPKGDATPKNEGGN